jgi:hypothetical protein
MEGLGEVFAISSSTGTSAGLTFSGEHGSIWIQYENALSHVPVSGAQLVCLTGLRAAMALNRLIVFLSTSEHDPDLHIVNCGVSNALLISKMSGT